MVLEGRRGGRLIIDNGFLLAENDWCRAECRIDFDRAEQDRLTQSVLKLKNGEPGGVQWESYDGRLSLMMATGKRSDIQVSVTVVGGADLLDRFELLLDFAEDDFYRSMGSPTELPHSVHEPS